MNKTCLASGVIEILRVLLIYLGMWNSTGGGIL